MATPRKFKTGRTITLYVKEWREYLNIRAEDCADLIGYARESYYRLEKDKDRFSPGELVELAAFMGINPAQFWQLPPRTEEEKLSIDRMLEGEPPEIKKAAIGSVRGIIGKLQ